MLFVKKCACSIKIMRRASLFFDLYHWTDFNEFWNHDRTVVSKDPLKTTVIKLERQKPHAKVC